MQETWTMRLYIPSGESAAAWRDALSDTVKAGGWQLVDRRVLNVTNHEWSMRPDASVARDASFAPVLAFATSWLERAGVSPPAAAAAARLLDRLSTDVVTYDIPHLALVTPSGIEARLSTDSRGEHRLMLGDDFSLPLRADDASLAGLLGLQSLSRRAELHIKFASTDDAGTLVGDAHDEYDGLFDELPAPWRVLVDGEETPVRNGGTRRGWLLSDGESFAGATEHETGVEIAIGVGVGVAANLIAPAVVRLAQALWARWNGKRATAASQANWKAPTHLRIERVHYADDGRMLASTTTSVRGPLDDEQLRAIINAATEVQPPISPPT
jgi:hypothetical protein